MARKTIVTLVDDLTGEAAENISTVEFALDGGDYELDLTDENSAKLHDALAPYVTAARKLGGGVAVGPAQAALAELSKVLGAALATTARR